MLLLPLTLQAQGVKRYENGMRGQNNDRPASLFKRHFAVRFVGVNMIYDPSYGQMHRTHTTIDANMSAFFVVHGDRFCFAKNPEGDQIVESSW